MDIKHPSKVRLIEPFLGFFLFATIAFYLINVFHTENWLWFRGNRINVTPSRIVIIEDGRRQALQPGQDGFMVVWRSAHGRPHSANHHPAKPGLRRRSVPDGQLGLHQHLCASMDPASE